MIFKCSSSLKLHFHSLYFWFSWVLKCLDIKRSFVPELPARCSHLLTHSGGRVWGSSRVLWRLLLCGAPCCLVAVTDLLQQDGVGESPLPVRVWCESRLLQELLQRLQRGFFGLTEERSSSTLFRHDGFSCVAPPWGSHWRFQVKYIGLRRDDFCCLGLTWFTFNLFCSITRFL